MKFEEKVKRERKKKGWSQEELAAKINMSQYFIRKLEKGRNKTDIAGAVKRDLKEVLDL